MFLKQNSIFPPEDCFYDKFREWGVWYSGEREYLLNYYEKCTILPMTEKSIFWAKIESSERNNMIHLPVAGDIAGMSSNLLFSETPRIVYNQESQWGDIITQIRTENGFENYLLEGAEICAAFGGVLLKIDIDTILSDMPILSHLTPLKFYPTFLRGRLWEVLMWREVRIDKNKDKVWRLFENRKRSIDGKNLIIEFKLFEGKFDNVGKEIDINSINETKELNLESIEIKNIYGLGAVYVPNIKPNKLAPGSPIGINDFNSSISLMDSLDATYSSWMNDIELGRGQIFIDEELLKRDNALDGTNTSDIYQDDSFSKFQRCFLKLNLSNYKMGGDNIKPIDINQFAIRTEDHMKTCGNLLSNIVNMCGYSPNTFGIDTDGNGRAESGTALRIRERKTFLTREKKSRYWQNAIIEILSQSARMYFSSINKSIEVNKSEISVELEDSIITDSKELSETIRNLDTAKAVSTYMKVKMLHPDWTEKDIEEEISRITKETGSDLNIDNFDLNNYSNRNNQTNQNENNEVTQNQTNQNKEQGQTIETQEMKE